MVLGLSQAEFDIACSAAVFNSIDQVEIKGLFKCLGAIRKSFFKGEYIFNAGQKIDQIGVVLSGSIDVIQEDAIGRKSIVTSIGSKGVFAEGIVAANLDSSPVSVLASSESVILLLNYNGMITQCESNCVFHSRLISNMLEIMSKKLIMLNKKLSYSLMKTIREKINGYLLDEYGKVNNKTFRISYNREELANYFGVDRSSLSRELSSMQKEGLINFQKSKFTLNEEFFEYI